MERTHLKIAEFAGAGLKPAPTPLRSGKPTRAEWLYAGNRSPAFGSRLSPERAALGAAPRQGPRAGRQVDLPPRAHFRRARGRQGRRSPACLKGRTSSTPRTPCARSAPESSASSSAAGAGAWDVHGVGVAGFREPREVL